MGRPSDFTQEIAATICERMAEGETLTEVCEQDGMPHISTVYRWKDANPAFREAYAQARKDLAHTSAEAAVIAAKRATDPQLARLKFDALRWHAGKLHYAAYGDKITQEHTGADGGPVTFGWKSSGGSS